MLQYPNDSQQRFPDPGGASPINMFSYHEEYLMTCCIVLTSGSDMLQGKSLLASENASLGKWRISGLPPDAPKGSPIVEVAFRVEKDGLVTIKAVLDDKDLIVQHLGEGKPTMQLRK